MPKFTLCVRMYVCKYVYLCICMYVCMYDVRHDIQIPCTRYVAINRLYLLIHRRISVLNETFAAVDMANHPGQISYYQSTVCFLGMKS